MDMKAAVFLLAILIAPVPALAGNESRYTATLLPGDRFEIVGRYSENSIYWCGAGHFAATQLGQAAGTKIYVIKGRSPSRTSPGSTAVTFGLSPAGGTASAPGYSIDPVPGMSLSIGQARGYCTDRSASDS